MDNWEGTEEDSLSEIEEETMVGGAFGEIDEVAFWKTKAEEWRKAASEAKEELEEFQNESRCLIFLCMYNSVFLKKKKTLQKLNLSIAVRPPPGCI